MMLITVTGRKTGKPYTTPVGYYLAGDILWVITSRDRTWWRNLKGGANVSLLLRHKIRNGYADLEQDRQAVCKRMIEYLQYEPRAAKPFGIRMADGAPNADDVARASAGRLFVRIKLT